MKKRRIRLVFLLQLFVMLISIYPVQTVSAAEESNTQGEETPQELRELYAGSAVLMDGETGRILFEKNGYEMRPMASTTKIMTCILALENLEEDTVVTVSSYAASQPKVHLGMREGEKYNLKDLLYSLMLESHNDSAVAIAEAVSGSVEDFSVLMNEKAKELGCENTCFLTPNGLDAEKEENGHTKIHSTTAAELARIMRYCIMESPEKETFREITGTKVYSFTAGERNFSCYNHNAFLTMMEGAFSGKTGFTGGAGYCYVGALERDGKTFIVALLACGWPNNKTYKWSDTKKLMNYGLEHYEYEDIYQVPELVPVPVENGIPASQNLTDSSYIDVVEVKREDSAWRLLLRDGEQVSVEKSVMDSLTAPVKAGECIGEILYKLNGEIIASSEIRTAGQVEAISLSWCISKIIENFLINF